MKQWIKSNPQDYKKKSSKKVKKTNKNQNPKNLSYNNSKQSSPSKNAQDIFDKLRLKNDNSPVNSLLMRDNPSPVHLFEKLSIHSQDKHERREMHENNSFIPNPTKRERLVIAIEKFALELKTLKINRCVIREAINKI